MCIKIKKELWNIGAWLYSRGPFSVMIVMIFSIWLLFKLSILNDNNILYFSFTLFGVFLGLFNFYLNKTKLNLELFEKRFEIYSDCRQALIIVLQKGTIDFHDAVKLLSSNRDKVRLLFGQEIVSYLEKIYKDCIDLDNTHRQLDTEIHPDLTGEPRAEISNKNHKLLTGLNEQLDKLPVVFEQYLSFKHIY